VAEGRKKDFFIFCWKKGSRSGIIKKSPTVFGKHKKKTALFQPLLGVFGILVFLKKKNLEIATLRIQCLPPEISHPCPKKGFPLERKGLFLRKILLREVGLS